MDKVDSVNDVELSRARVQELIYDAISAANIELIPEVHGCRDDERQQIAIANGLSSLPPTYDEYLRLAGHIGDATGTYTGPFHGDWSYRGLSVTDPEDGATVLAQELSNQTGTNIEFHGGLAVILAHEGYLVEYIDGTSDESPVMLLDDSGRHIKIHEQFVHGFLIRLISGNVRVAGGEERFLTDKLVQSCRAR